METRIVDDQRETRCDLLGGYAEQVTQTSARAGTDQCTIMTPKQEAELMMKNVKLDLPARERKWKRGVGVQASHQSSAMDEQELAALEKRCLEQLAENRSSSRTRDEADPHYMKATISSEPDIWISIN